MSKWLFTLQRVRWHPEDSQTVPAWPKHRTLWKSAAGNGPKTLDAIFQVLFVCLLGLTSTLLQLELAQLTTWSSRPFSGSADLLSGAVPDSKSVLGLCDIKGFHLQWSGVLDSKNSTSSHSLTPPSVLPAVSSQPHFQPIILLFTQFFQVDLDSTFLLVLCWLYFGFSIPRITF